VLISVNPSASRALQPHALPVLAIGCLAVRLGAQPGSFEFASRFPNCCAVHASLSLQLAPAAAQLFEALEFERSPISSFSHPIETPLVPIFTVQSSNL